MPRIRSVATALPENRIDQRAAKELVRRVFGDHRLLEVFERTGVATRYFAFPPEYYLDGRTFAQRNRDYVEQALVLGERAARAALDRAGLAPSDVGHFYFVTTTGLATPSVDARLALRLGMRRDVVRNPLFGIGCAGGVAAIARASELLRGRPGERALVLSVELCGQTFRNRDRSPGNVVGTALFGDGAAAAVIEGDAVAGGGAEVVACSGELFPQTEDAMGWEFLDDGFKLVLSIDVPKVVRERVVPAIRTFLDAQGVKPSDVRHFVVHPGGTKIIEAFEESFGATLTLARETLRDVGNLSSASVLFVLERAAPRPGDLGLMAAPGPGFAVEQVLLRW